MPKFDCDNPAIEKVLVELYNLITENGGYIHDAVTVREKDGEFSILSNLPSDNHEELITIPESCLPITDDFVIKVQDDNLVVEVKSDAVMKSQIKAIELMIEIYNITNKLTKHRETDIWQALRNSPELLLKILEARYRSPKIVKYYESYKNGKFEELSIDTLMGSRVAGYKRSGRENLSPRLMPFIDFVNHSVESPIYLNSVFKPGTLSIINSKPVPESNECFACYGIFDALDSLIVYGFSDVSSPLVRSIPLQYDFHVYGHIQVNGQIPQHYLEPLPDSVQDLRLYMPYVSNIGRDELELSHLIIPGENAPLALRRVLDYRIKSWKPALKQAVLKDIIINFESVILNKNIEYYEELSEVVDTIDYGYIPENFRQTLNTLIRLQLSKLHKYQIRISKLG